jgi:hypothetical protein
MINPSNSLPNRPLGDKFCEPSSKIFNSWDGMKRFPVMYFAGFLLTQ